MREAVIVSAVRTPIGSIAIGGTLKNVQPETLVKTVLENIIQKVSLDKSAIDEVIIRQTKQTTNAPNIARVASLMAGIPEDVPAYTVHRQCASGMQAMLNGMQQIQCNYNDAACGLILMAKETAEKLGIKPLVKIIGAAASGLGMAIAFENELGGN